MTENRSRNMRTASLVAGAVGALLTATPGFAQAETNLTVYTALDEGLVAELIPAFEAAHPGTHLDVIRDSAGSIVARLLAEKSNPQADAVAGVPANALIAMAQQDMLEPYKPAEFDMLKPGMRDETSAVPAWSGQDAWSSAICFNTAEAGDLPPPVSWKDLTNPIYQGKIIMADPGSSGTALTMVASWLQTMGEQDGWAFMTALDANVSQYVHSGSGPCKMAARGETVIGLSYTYPGVKAINDGAPIQVILPSEGNGAEVEGNAILKGTDTLAEAQAFMDFLISDAGQTITSHYMSIVARQGIKVEIPNYPAAEEEAKMHLIDFAWLAEHKPAVLEEWKTRFGAKSAPKN